MSGGGRFGKLLSDVGDTLSDVATFTATVVQTAGDTAGQFASDVVAQSRAVGQVLGNQTGDVIHHGQAMAQVVGNQAGQVLQQGVAIAGVAADTVTDAATVVVAAGQQVVYSASAIGHHNKTNSTNIRRPAPTHGPQ